MRMLMVGAFLLGRQWGAVGVNDAWVSSVWQNVDGCWAILLHPLLLLAPFGHCENDVELQERAVLGVKEALTESSAMLVLRNCPGLEWCHCVCFEWLLGSCRV